MRCYPVTVSGKSCRFVVLCFNEMWFLRKVGRCVLYGDDSWCTGQRNRKTWRVSCGPYAHTPKRPTSIVTSILLVVRELETCSVNLNKTLLKPCWILVVQSWHNQDLCVTQLERSLWRLCVDLASPAGWRGEMRQLPYPTWGVEVDNFQIFPADAWSSPWSNHQIYPNIIKIGWHGGGQWGCRCTGENLYKFWHWVWSLQAVVWICSFALSFSSSWLLGILSTTWRRVAGMADTVWN